MDNQVFDEALVCCKCKNYWGKGASLHISSQRGLMGQPWRRMRGGSVPCPQLWSVVHVRCPHSFISFSEREFHLLKAYQPWTGQGFNTPDSRLPTQVPCQLLPRPVSDLHYGVFALDNSSLYFLSLLTMQMQMWVKSTLISPKFKKSKWGPNVENIRVSKRSNHCAQRRLYLENLACVQEFSTRQSKSDEAEAVPSLQGLRSQQSRKLEHLLVQIPEWWARIAEKAPATNPFLAPTFVE